MGLDVSDDNPVGISLQDAYTAIRGWYRGLKAMSSTLLPYFSPHIIQ